MNQTTTEEELFESIRQGDKKAFDAFFLRYYPMLCAYAGRFVDAEDTQEIIQDIMVWFWENRENIVVEFSLSSYMFRAVRNKCMNHLHKIHLHEQVHQTIANHTRLQMEDPDFYIVEELTQKIEEALNRLPESYREAFVLNRFEGKTYNEIAILLGISSKTIDYRIQQALKNLRVQLKDYLPLLMTLIGM